MLRTSCENATDTFQCLVDVDVDTLQQANLAITASGFYGTFVTVPVVDGEFIQGSPTRQSYTGRLNGVNCLSLLHAFLFSSLTVAGTLSRSYQFL